MYSKHLNNREASWILKKCQNCWNRILDKGKQFTDYEYQWYSSFLMGKHYSVNKIFTSCYFNFPFFSTIFFCLQKEKRIFTHNFRKKVFFSIDNFLKTLIKWENRQEALKLKKTVSGPNLTIISYFLNFIHYFIRLRIYSLFFFNTLFISFKLLFQ